MKLNTISVLITSVVFSMLQLQHVSGEVGLCEMDLLLASGEELASGQTKTTEKCTATMTNVGSLEISTTEDGTLRWTSLDNRDGDLEAKGGPFTARLDDRGNFKVEDSTGSSNFDAVRRRHKRTFTYSVEVNDNCVPILCRCSRGRNCRAIW